MRTEQNLLHTAIFRVTFFAFSLQTRIAMGCPSHSSAVTLTLCLHETPFHNYYCQRAHSTDSALHLPPIPEGSCENLQETKSVTSMG